MLWSVKIDGTELHDPVTAGRHVMVPELDTEPDMDLILAPVDGDYPAAIRLQPREGRITLLCQKRACTETDWQTELAFLRGVLTNGQHVLTAQIRGMPTPKTMTIYITGRAVEFQLRRLVATATAPKPVLA